MTDPTASISLKRRSLLAGSSAIAAASLLPNAARAATKTVGFI